MVLAILPGGHAHIASDTNSCMEQFIYSRSLLAHNRSLIFLSISHSELIDSNSKAKQISHVLQTGSLFSYQTATLMCDKVLLSFYAWLLAIHSDVVNSLRFNRLQAIKWL